MANGVNLFDLAATISAKTDGVEKALTSTQQKVVALAKEFEKTETAAKKATSSMGTSGLALEKQLVAADSAQKQRSTALLSQWKKEEQAAAKKGQEIAKAAEQGASAVERDLKGALQQVSPGLAGLTEAVGPLGFVALALAAIGAAAVVVGSEFYSLVKSTADFEGKLYDLSQQTGVSVELLSTLDTLAATTGSDMGSVSASLGIFQKHLEAAEDPTDKMAKKLKDLHISTKDTETALKDSFKVLSQMPEGYRQTALALELFGRGGKSLLAMLKESNGDIDGAMAKFKELGIVVGTDNAKAADAFNDAYEILTRQLRGTTAALVQESIPTFTRFFQLLSEDGPKGGKGMTVLAGLVNAAVTSILSDFLGATYGVSTFVNQMSQAGSNLANGEFMWALRDMVGMLRTVGKAATGGFKADALSSLDNHLGAFGDSVSANVFAKKGGGSVGGGGKSGGGSDPAATAKKLAELRLKALVDELKFADEENKRSFDRRIVDLLSFDRRYREIETMRHDAVVAGLATEEAAAERMRKGKAKDIALLELEGKKAAEDRTHKKNIADENDRLRKVQDSVNEALTKQNQVLSDYANHVPDWMRSAFDFIDAKTKEGYVWDALTKKIYLNMAAQAAADRSTRARHAALDTSTRNRRVRPDGSEAVTELGNGTFVLNREEDRLDRPRRVFQQHFEAVREKLRQFANDVTGVLSNSIRVGFEQGAAAGFKSLAQGFIDILARMAEEWLASSIFKMLQSVLNPSGGTGGGGFWGKLLGAVLGIGGAAAGGAGGGLGGFGGTTYGFGYAKGGIVPGIDRGYDSVPAMLRPGEQVIPVGGSAGGGNTYVFHISTPDARSFMSGPTQHQIMMKLNHASAKAGLTG